MDGGRTIRLLRMRADDRLKSALHPGSASEAARLHVSSRAAVTVGDRVAVEISFGPLADEIVLHGAVADVHPSTEGRSPRVVIALPRAEISRVRYVRSVLDGSREASARRDRRIPVDLAVTWRWGRAQYASRLRDLSRGGAFIASRCLPTVGAQVDVVITHDGHDHALKLPAIVSWVRAHGQDTGFGVHFRHQNRDEVARLTAVVRDCE
jgi:Tfp pilus assembly protein PilZ